MLKFDSIKSTFEIRISNENIRSIVIKGLGKEKVNVKSVIFPQNKTKILI